MPAIFGTSSPRGVPLSVHDLKLSNLALKAASVSPRLTATAMKMVAPHLPPYWVINEIATRHDLHIRAKASEGVVVLLTGVDLITLIPI